MNNFTDGTLLALAAGGTEEFVDYLDTVETYSPATDSWSYAPATFGGVKPSRNFGCVANNMLIVAGGVSNGGSSMSQIMAVSVGSLQSTTSPYTLIGSLPVPDCDVACIPFY
jgi:hypothetical protein